MIAAEPPWRIDERRAAVGSDAVDAAPRQVVSGDAAAGKGLGIDERKFDGA